MPKCAGMSTITLEAIGGDESGASPAVTTVACSSCGGKMELDSPQPGDTFECPHCTAEVTYRPRPVSQVEAKPRVRLGQSGPVSVPETSRVGLVDGSPTPKRNIPKGDRAVAKGYPPTDAPETEIMRVHPSMARTQPFLYAGLVLLATFGLLGAAWMFFRGRPVWLLSVPGLLGAGGAVWLLWWWLQTRGSEIRVTSKRLIDTDGLFTRRVSEVLHKDIRRIELRQTFWQRLCGVGEIAISADADEGPEVFMANVPQPEKIREVIDLYRPL